MFVIGDLLETGQFIIKIEPGHSDEKQDASTKTRASKKKIKNKDPSPPKRKINIEIVVNKEETQARQKEMKEHQCNIQEILLNTNATPIRCHKGIGYTCCFCEDQYRDPAHLKKHTLEQHTQEDKANFMKGSRNTLHGYFVKLDITDLKCNICDENIDNVEAMIEHLKKIHNKNLFPKLNSHILPFKLSKDTLRCCVCLNIFNTFKALQEHMNVHYRNYICTVCDAGFVNKHILSRHEECHKIGVFTCGECSRTFDTARKKTLHQRTKHAEPKLRNKCGYCSERFKEFAQKLEHLVKVHGIVKPTIDCQVCNKSFKTKHEWRVHTARIHLMQKDHNCTLCEMRFYTKHELENHMTKHTGLRQFRCDVCFKSYGRKSTLRDHMRIHADDRRFECTMCGQAFVQKCTWRSHMRSKHGEDI
ncbi:gastrula zinc finger protein XlCGF26.1-like [Bicyclus anynana]|uniref:Gastrula zinc finger protein XlCGF26.1-like n=1 Tax=Bicyclus anynana TaxID=110368 RepID=A0ABM3M351_BICAN|nr:gastrula zinc finger protein XlCGF26.1-like [Bicyclus anynana]